MDLKITLGCRDLFSARSREPKELLGAEIVFITE
jgi:hypothetical protein